nr:hypothetical protein CFP56_07614 [Quercus suber]
MTCRIELGRYREKDSSSMLKALKDESISSGSWSLLGCGCMCYLGRQKILSALECFELALALISGMEVRGLIYIALVRTQGNLNDSFQLRPVDKSSCEFARVGCSDEAGRSARGRLPLTSQREPVAFCN